MQIRIYYEDTDFGGVVYHANYFKFLERARSERFFAAGVSPAVGNAHFVVSKLEAKFIAPAKFGDLIEVRSDLIQMKNLSFSLLQEIYLQDKKLFSATVTLAFVESGKPKAIDKEIKDLILQKFGRL